MGSKPVREAHLMRYGATLSEVEARPDYPTRDAAAAFKRSAEQQFKTMERLSRSRTPNSAGSDGHPSGGRPPDRSGDASAARTRRIDDDDDDELWASEGFESHHSKTTTRCPFSIT